MPLLFFSCGSTPYKRTYDSPTTSSALNFLVTKNSRLESIKISSLMSYWQKGNRLKPTVLVMAKKGAFIRLNAMGLSDDVEADLACNGSTFSYQDFRNNCQLDGVCNKKAVSSLLKMNVAPDDFLLMTMGLTPLIPFDQSELTWDGKKQREILTLGGKNKKQIVELASKNKYWDVLSSKVWDPSGNIEWIIENKDFFNMKDWEGRFWRVPQKTRFSQPAANLKIEIRWVEREINHDIPLENFEMTPETGIPFCRQKIQ